MAQVARPVADVVSQSFVNAAAATTGLYASLDEVHPPSDADYVECPTSPDQAVYVCKLTSLSDPVSSNNHLLRYAYEKAAVGGRVDLTVQLREGYQHEGIPGELIVEYSHVSIPETLTEQLQTLTAAEADAITNYADLYLRFVFDQP